LACIKAHLFTVVVCTPTVTAELLARLTVESFSYANEMKGAYKGLQSGFAVIPAVVAERVLPEARQLVERRPAHHWAALTLPVVVDLSAGATYSYAGQVWGQVLIVPWVRKRIAATLTAPTA
jgi:hypothetical protein